MAKDFVGTKRWLRPATPCETFMDKQKLPIHRGTIAFSDIGNLTLAGWPEMLRGQPLYHYFLSSQVGSRPQLSRVASCRTECSTRLIALDIVRLAINCTVKNSFEPVVALDSVAECPGNNRGRLTYGRTKRTFVMI
ncbi:MAG: hypothetical protein FJ145_26265 [Deltaproteobacteria bacterium]|nr:hypothetical protein [Deltaproteobacteria bacterium]